MSIAETSQNLSTDFPSSPRHQLYRLYSDKSISNRKKLKALESLDEIYGYDLIFVFSLILENKWNGYLNIVDAKQLVSGLTFSGGKISRIDLPDRDTLIGSLLVSEGYVSPAELNEVIRENRSNIGEALILKNLITTQQMVNVLLLQMRLRLSRYVSANLYQVSFSVADIEPTKYSIDQKMYMNLLYDWVMGRFEQQWLNELYVEWEDLVIELDLEKLKEISDDSKEILNVSLQVLKSQAPNTSLKGVLKKTELSLRPLILKGLHFLLSVNAARFLDFETSTGKEVNSAPEVLAKPSASRLQLVYEELKSKGEIAALRTLVNVLKMKVNNIEAINSRLTDLIRSEGSQLDSNAKLDLSKLSFYILMNRALVLDSLTQTQNEFSREIDFDTKTKLKQFLINKDLYSAGITLTELKGRKIIDSELSLYTAWSSLAYAIDNEENIEMRTIGIMLDQVAPEVKISAEYYFVMYLFNYLAKKYPEANDFFKKCVLRDRSFEKLQLPAVPKKK